MNSSLSLGKRSWRDVKRGSELGSQTEMGWIKRNTARNVTKARKQEKVDRQRRLKTGRHIKGLRLSSRGSHEQL